MITGLLFSLASRTPVPANDVDAEGHKFPPSPRKQRAPRQNVIPLTKHIAVVMTLIGLVLGNSGTAPWSLGRSSAVSTQAASINFTPNMGAIS